MRPITRKELAVPVGRAFSRAALIDQHAHRDREIAAYLDEAIPEP